MLVLFVENYVLMVVLSFSSSPIATTLYFGSRLGLTVLFLLGMAIDVVVIAGITGIFGRFAWQAWNQQLLLPLKQSLGASSNGILWLISTFIWRVPILLGEDAEFLGMGVYGVMLIFQVHKPLMVLGWGLSGFFFWLFLKYQDIYFTSSSGNISRTGYGKSVLVTNLIAAGLMLIDQFFFVFYLSFIILVVKFGVVPFRGIRVARRIMSEELESYDSENEDDVGRGVKESLEILREVN